MLYDAPLHESRPPREASDEAQAAYAAAVARREREAGAGAVPA